MAQPWERRLGRALGRAEQKGDIAGIFRDIEAGGGLGSNLAGILANIPEAKEQRATERAQGLTERFGPGRLEDPTLRDQRGEFIETVGTPPGTVTADTYRPQGWSAVGAAGDWGEQVGAFDPSKYGDIFTAAQLEGGLGAESPYKGYETSALGKLGGIGGAAYTGSAFGGIMGDVTAAMQSHDLKGASEKLFKQALAPGLTGAGKEYYNALSKQMADVARRERAVMSNSLANQNLVGGSMQWQAERNFTENIINNKTALLENIKREDSKMAISAMLEEEGFMVNLAGIAGDLAKASGQTELGATQSTLSYMGDIMADTTNKMGLQLGQGQLGLQAELANLDQFARMAEFGGEMERWGGDLDARLSELQANIGNMNAQNFNNYVSNMLGGILGVANIGADLGLGLLEWQSGGGFAGPLEQIIERMRGSGGGPNIEFNPMNF